METEEFWALVDEAREAADGDVEQQAALLTTALARRTPSEIVSFDATFHTTRAQGYSCDLWAVGYLAAGGMSDDAFLDFRALLIGRGQSVWQRAVDDPDSLADVLEDDPDDAIGDAEGLAYAATAAYERTTGSPMPTAPGGEDDDAEPGETESGDTEPGDTEAGDARDHELPGAQVGPSGLPWDENDPQGLAKRFPRAWARWGTGEGPETDDRNDAGAQEEP